MTEKLTRKLTEKLAPFAENIGEAGVACLVTMVQGNLLLLGLSHWITASQTGLIAGAATATLFMLVKTNSRWVLASLLGLLTAVVDYFVHPGMIGESAFIEPLITGFGAAALSYITGYLIARYRARRRLFR